MRHGWRGDVRGRSPRVSTRGFLGRVADKKPPAEAGGHRVTYLPAYWIHSFARAPERARTSRGTA